MKVIKDKGEDKIEVEGDLEEIEETFYEQTVSSEDLEDIKVNPKIENLHKNIKEELEQIEKEKGAKNPHEESGDKIEAEKLPRENTNMQMKRHDI